MTVSSEMRTIAQQTEMPLTHAIRCADTLEHRSFLELARTLALEHHKWDAQVGDVAALAPFPLVLSRDAWRQLQSLATALARETIGLEHELADRPDLYARLGLRPRLGEGSWVVTGY